MAKHRLMLLSFLFAAVSQYCNADDVVSDNCITVFGKAEVSAPADQAKISFSVSGYGSSLRNAVDKTKEKLATISKKLVEAGLKEGHLNTSYFYSGENQGSKPFLSNKKDYSARITMYVSVDDLSLLEPVLFILSESEVDNISKVYFSLQDDSSFKQKARQLAIQKAKTKAEEFAQQLNISLGRATIVEEIPQMSPQSVYYLSNQQYTSNVSYQSMLQRETGGHDSTEYFTGTIRVCSMVKVVFKIETE